MRKNTNPIRSARQAMQVVRPFLPDPDSGKTVALCDYRGIPFLSFMAQKRPEVEIIREFLGTGCLPEGNAATVVVQDAKAGLEPEVLVRELIPHVSVAQELKTLFRGVGLQLTDYILTNGKRFYSFTEEKTYRI